MPGRASACGAGARAGIGAPPGDDTPTAVMIRQILGSVAQFEKAMLVSKLRGARERRKAATGKCEGRKSLSESRPEVVALAKRLARYPINHRKRSLRDVAAGRCQSNGVRRYAARPPTRERRSTPRERATQPRQQSVSACRLAW
jgi:DNA invertase Pin-like site-specific DNA recombinase